MFCTVKEAYKQIALVVNMALTVGCCFVFGYFAAYYSSLATDSVSGNTCIDHLTLVLCSFSAF